MLVSHRHQFIFLKTVKTAGTSVESYFEPFCMAHGEWKPSHRRDEYVSGHGIVGARGRDNKKHTWWSHMPAHAVREQLGEKIWDSYFKFTTIRNPFSKLVSGWYHFGRKAVCRDIPGGADASFPRGVDADIADFRRSIAGGYDIEDSDKYIIDGAACVDHFIRFEHLEEDIAKVIHWLNLEKPAHELPRLKAGRRPADIAIRQYYDGPTERTVRENHAWEIERFGYSMPES